jgi:hypothetical protein
MVKIAAGGTSRLLWERNRVFRAAHLFLISKELQALFITSIVADMQEQITEKLPATAYGMEAPGKGVLETMPSVYRWSVTLENPTDKEVEVFARFTHKEPPVDHAKENRRALLKATAAKRKREREAKFPPGFGEEK